MRFVGPQRSLRAPVGAAVVYGDETSFGLVEALGGVGVLEVRDPAAAAAFVALHPGAPTAVRAYWADGKVGLD